MTIKQLDVNILSNPEDRQKLLKVIKDCSDSMTRAKSEKDFVREAVAEISEELEVPKRLVNRMVKVYHKQNYDEEVATHEQFEQLYETIVK